MPFGIKVSQISRFVSDKEKFEIYASIKNGSTQVIVGTHALLSDKIFFKKLGLIIYDEEQKLGTLELLLTSPLKETEIVIGKFLAAFSIILLSLISSSLIGGYIF